MERRSPFAYERLEVYRTALEFERVCGLVGSSLPARKINVRDLLARESGKIVIKIANGAECASRRGSFAAFRSAHRVAQRCHSMLDALRMTVLGSQAFVTAGLELFERIDVGLKELIAQTGEDEDARPPEKSPDGIGPDEESTSGGAEPR